MTKSEEPNKKLDTLICFMPTIAIMIQGILETSERTNNMMWMGIFIVDLMYLIIYFIRNKNRKTHDIILTIIGFVIGLGFIIHFALKI